MPPKKPEKQNEVESDGNPYLCFSLLVAPRDNLFGHGMQVGIFLRNLGAFTQEEWEEVWKPHDQRLKDLFMSTVQKISSMHGPKSLWQRPK